MMAIGNGMLVANDIGSIGNAIQLEISSSNGSDKSLLVGRRGEGGV